MQRQQKLLLSFMVWGLVLFYGITVEAALTPQEIHKIAKDSTVHLFLLNADRSVHSTGSGFFVAPKHIATNYHVIEDMLTGQPKLVGGVKLVGKEEIYAIEDVVDFDKENDLAIVKVREVKGTGINVPALLLGDSEAVQVGDLIYIMSNPLRLEGTFIDGKISNILSAGSGKILQMNATIAQGSSGGPVLNESGKVIGICVAGVGRGLDINFAIPVNYLKALMPIPPTSVKPKSVKPKVAPPPVKSKPAEPKVAPPPVKTKPVKPKVNLPPVEPKLAPQEIAKIALDSTVHLSLRDAKGNSWTGSGFIVDDGQIATNLSRYQ